MLGQEAVGQGSKRALQKIHSSIQKQERKLVIEAFDLYDLDFMANVHWKNLETVHMNRNMVSSIDVLNKFLNLRYIDASNCYIEEVNFTLPKLEYLDISNNYLRNFPNLQHMPRLKYLNLNSNQLVDLFQANFENIQHLSQLDIGRNMIEFDSESDETDFLNKLCKLASLQSLTIEENPFLEAKKSNLLEYILPKLPLLEQLNGKKIPKKSKVMLKKTKTTDAQPQQNQKSKKKMPLPTLEVLLFQIESANSHPHFTMDHLKELTEQTDLIISKLKQAEAQFRGGLQDQDEIEDAIEQFMQNAQLLIDSHKEMQGIMFSILAKLSIIKCYDFGISCFNTLKDQMQSGKEMEAKIITVLKNEVINKMKQTDPTVIPVSLLLGLNDLIEETENSNLLSGMYDTCFPVWLRMYREKIEFCKRQEYQMGNDDHYDIIISLISLSVKDNPENVQKFKQKDLHMPITVVIKNSSWIHDRYIPCLHLIARVSDADEEAATQFMEAFVHTNLLNQIKKSMTIIKKLDGLFEENSKETYQQQKVKYQTLAAEITTLGGLLKSKSHRYLITEEFSMVIIDIMSILSQPKADPILLTAVCTFALYLFNCEEIRFNKRNMTPFYEMTSDLNNLIPYMGFEKYPDLILMAKKYNMDSSQIGLTVPEVDAGQGGQVKHHQILTSLNNLDDPILIDLFISMIKLIKFVCLEATINDKNDLFDIISESLNGINREAALFNCLAIPDDNVRLACVQCLFVVPLDEFDQEEIAQITNIMISCKNIGSGQNELVLSTVCMLCTKLVCGDASSPDTSSSIFQQKFGQKTVEEALSVLQRNLMRVVDQENEDREKYALSLAVLNFLKASTQVPGMKSYLQGQEIIFRKILISEDLNSSDRIGRVPIDIENTIIGREVNTLMECLTSIESIQPYCDVSLRILMRIADTLMFRHQCHYLEISETVENIESLFQFQEDLYRKKRQQEQDYWVDRPEDFIDSMKEQNTAIFTDFVSQHKNFTQSNGVALLIMYLIVMYPENEEMMKALVSDQFDDRKPKRLENELKKCKEVYESKFRKKYDRDVYSVRTYFMGKEESGKHKSSENTNQRLNDNCKKTKINDFRQHLLAEELGADYNQRSVVVDETVKKNEVHQKLVTEQQVMSRKDNRAQSFKEKRGDGFLNKKIRSLTVSAFLRCLYASIEYAPNVHLKKQTLKNIREPLNFRAITQLCDSTNFDETANIGGKYLRVMRHVIKIPYDKDFEENSMLMHYEMISIVIQKVLCKIVDKMQKDIELSEGDKVTIFEIATTFHTIVFQTNYFMFSKLNVLDLHVEKERELYNRHRLTGNCQMPLCIVEENEKGPWKLKCEFDEHQYNQPISKYNYQVDMPLVREKRTVQNKIVEQFLLQIFSKKSIFSLVDILFKDMEEDYKSVQKSIQVEDSSEDSDDEDDEGNRSIEDVTKYHYDIEAYMEKKANMTIEIIKDIVGEIMNSCSKKMKYDILENIIKGVIFERKMLRESFMQEILNAAEQSTYRIYLQKYINQPFYLHQNSDTLSQSKHFRVLYCCNLDINNTLIEEEHDDYTQLIRGEKYMDVNFKSRIFVLTNQNIQILKNLPAKFRCPKCPPQNFCPRGPTLDYIIDFEDIDGFVNFKQLPQKIIIKYSQLKNTEQPIKFQVTLNIPTITDTDKIMKAMVETLGEVRQKSKMARLVNQNLASQVLNNQKKLTAMKITNTDLYVQLDLRNLIRKINPKISKYELCDTELVHCSLAESFLPSQYVETNIERQFQPIEAVPTEQLIQFPYLARYFNQNQEYMKYTEGPMDGQELNEDKLEISGAVYIFTIDQYMVLLNEKWDQWAFHQSTNNLKQLFKSIKNGKKKEKDEKELENERYLEASLLDINTKAMLKRCWDIKLQLFNVIAMIKVNQIMNIDIHQGRVPSVELSFIPSGGKKGGIQHKMKFVFPGDMERQKFINGIIELQKTFEAQMKEGSRMGSDEDEVESERSNGSDTEDFSMKNFKPNWFKGKQ